MPRDGEANEIGGQGWIAAKGQCQTAPKQRRASVANQAATPSLAVVLQVIKDNQADRRFCQQQRSRADRSVEQFIATTALSYDVPTEKYSTLGEAQAKIAKKQAAAVFAAAKKFREDVEKKEQEFENALRDGAAYDLSKILPNVPHKLERLKRCITIIITSHKGRIAWDKKLKDAESEMVAEVKGLIIWLWAKEITGFGEKGLAIILAEAGDLSNYPTKEKLWKRLGLAVNDAGRRQGVVGETSSRQERAEKFIKEKYSPKRRAEMWTLSESMMRHQWTGHDAVVREHLKEQCGVELPKALKGEKLVEAAAAAGLKDIPLMGRPAGPYGIVYLKELLKAMKPAEPGCNRTSAFATRKHQVAHARRLAWKALVKDLWKEWRRLAREI